MQKTIYGTITISKYNLPLKTIYKIVKNEIKEAPITERMLKPSLYVKIGKVSKKKVHKT